ncbi:Fasciclin domain-containing protein [Mariniphaga anaerophila]|uniref:Fasciclin domain-containing protein n=1 Tax=Mariniphaga anaerophila TaxID=1484053 RepID=A0A1M4Y5D3_9BACT|nr:fasciclin domain-containing protein [Mariniphaga anaerophila]SHF00652.1 Fasciclin domain-containing protein [Mariniphaga anaerophila]
MNKIINKSLIVLIALVMITGCDLSLQTDYDYKESVLDPHVEMTAWEYFQSRQDVFEVLTEAIEYCGLKDYYTQTEVDYTFLALNNTAMKLYMMDRFPGTSSITECDKEAVKKLLLYHIVDGAYSSYSQLQIEPMYVLTMLKGEEGLMTMLVRKNPWQADAGKVIVNDTGSNGNSPMRGAVTSNIIPTNGVVHVFESYCYYKQ